MSPIKKFKNSVILQHTSPKILQLKPNIQIL